MPDEQKVTVTCNGVELLSWRFEFGGHMKKTGAWPLKDTHVPDEGTPAPGFVIKETVGPAIANTRGITEAEFAERAARHSARLSEDMADRRRDDNLRNVFGG